MILLYHRTSKPTGKVIAQALRAHGCFGVQHLLRRGAPEGIFETLIRWGNPKYLPFNPGYEIQTAQAICRASDKLRSFELMEQAGVRIPEYTAIGAEARAWVVQGKTVFGRTRHGARGLGITVYHEPDAYVQNHELYVQFVQNLREYRMHVVGDEVVRVQRKYLDFPDQFDGGFIKNYAHGYRFRAPRNRLKPDREEAAVNAVKALGLDFGAVDLVIGSEDDLAYVLEVNTAPSCSPLTAHAYVGALSRMIEERTGREVVPDYDSLRILGGGEDRDTEDEVY